MPPLQTQHAETTIKKGASTTEAPEYPNSAEPDYFSAIFFGAFLAGFFAFFAITFSSSRVAQAPLTFHVRSRQLHPYTSATRECQENSAILGCFPDLTGSC